MLSFEYFDLFLAVKTPFMTEKSNKIQPPDSFEKQRKYYLVEHGSCWSAAASIVLFVCVTVLLCFFFNG